MHFTIDRAIDITSTPVVFIHTIFIFKFFLFTTVHLIRYYISEYSYVSCYVNTFFFSQGIVWSIAHNTSLTDTLQVYIFDDDIYSQVCRYKFAVPWQSNDSKKPERLYFYLLWCLFITTQLAGVHEVRSSPHDLVHYIRTNFTKGVTARRTEKSEKWQPAFDGTRTQSLLVKKSLHLQQIIFPLNFFSLMKIIRNTLFKIVILRLFLVGFVARTAKDLQPAVVLCFFLFFFFFFWWTRYIMCVHWTWIRNK